MSNCKNLDMHTIHEVASHHITVVIVVHLEDIYCPEIYVHPLFSQIPGFTFFLPLGMSYMLIYYVHKVYVWTSSRKCMDPPIYLGVLLEPTESNKGYCHMREM